MIRLTFASRRMDAAAAGAALLLVLSCCAGGTGQDRTPEVKPRHEQTPIDAFDELRQQIYMGNFSALYVFASEEYRARRFPIERIRLEVASHPGLKELGLSAAAVAGMEPKAVVDTYFLLMGEEMKKSLAVQLSETKVGSLEYLPDGRASMEIIAEGGSSRIIWVKEKGLWKMDSEESIDSER